MIRPALAGDEAAIRHCAQNAYVRYVADIEKTLLPL
jgi:hypothetical protein